MRGKANKENGISSRMLDHPVPRELSIGMDRKSLIEIMTKDNTTTEEKTSILVDASKKLSIMMAKGNISRIRYNLQRKYIYKWLSAFGFHEVKLFLYKEPEDKK